MFIRKLNRVANFNIYLFHLFFMLHDADQETKKYEVKAKLPPRNVGTLFYVCHKPEFSLGS